MRAALGASRGALRRTLLAESLVLCGAGAVLGVLLARPLVAVVGALRRALLGARARRHRGRQPALGRRRPGDGRGRGARLRPAAAVAARADRARAWRAAACASRRARTAACASSPSTQIALSFVLLAGAGMLLATLVALQTANTGYDMRQVLARRRPAADRGVRRRRRSTSIEEATRRIGELPGVERVARRELRAVARRRHASARRSVCRRGLHAGGRRRGPARRGCGSSRPASSRCSASRSSPAATSPTDDRARQRARRDRQPERRAAAVPERRRARTAACGGPIRYFGKPAPRRIVGVVADVDDENVVPGPALTDLSPVAADAASAGRLFVHAAGDPVRARAGR